MTIPSARREPGLRARKKQQTRERIAQTARLLFAERGFEAVSVAEVARQADVSEKTVFNYFPTKEDLVYWRSEVFGAQMLATVRNRSHGESLLAAFQRFVLTPRGVLAEQENPEQVERLVALAGVIVGSPALLRRGHEILDAYTTSLAALIAEETGADPDDIQPRVVAGALMGVHRALTDFARRRILAGMRNPQLAREVRAQGERAFRTLELGLRSYPPA